MLLGGRGRGWASSYKAPLSRLRGVPTSTRAGGVSSGPITRAARRSAAASPPRQGPPTSHPPARWRSPANDARPRATRGGATLTETQVGRVSRRSTDPDEEESHDHRNCSAARDRGRRRGARARRPRRMRCRTTDGCRHPEPRAALVHCPVAVAVAVVVFRCTARPLSGADHGGRGAHDPVVCRLRRGHRAGEPTRHRRGARDRRRIHASGRRGTRGRARRRRRPARHRRLRRVPVRLRDDGRRQPRDASPPRGRARLAAPGRRRDGGRRHPLGEHPQTAGASPSAPTVCCTSRPEMPPSPVPPRIPVRSAARSCASSPTGPYLPTTRSRVRRCGVSVTATRRASGGMPRASCTRRSSARTPGTS